MDHQVCLRWNNFQSSLTTTLENLWDEESFCDVTLFCEGQEIRAHKVVLSACSSVFKNLLQRNICQHPIVILHDITLSVLEGILQFVYKGEVNIEQDLLHDLLRAASSLQIKGLAGINDQEKEFEEAQSSKKSRKPSGSGTNLRNSNESYKRKKPDVTPSNFLTEESNEHFVLLTPKKEAVSDDEQCGFEAINIDIDKEPTSANQEVTDSIQGEDPLMRQPSNSTRSQMDKSLAELPNLNKGVKQNQFDSLFYYLIWGIQGFTCSNAQYPPYPCPFCRRAYASWGFRRRHIKAIHTTSPRLTCKWCNSTLASREDWGKHVINEHHLSRSEAEQGLTVLEEAHMVLQTTKETIDVFKQVIDRPPMVKE